MSWADRSRPSPILTGLFPPSPSRPEGPGNSLRWHFTQAQKLLVVLLAISLAYLAYTLYSDEVLHIRDFSLHAGPHKHDPAQPITKTHAPDKDDINPTMPSNIRKALVLSSFKDQNNDWLLRLQNVSPRYAQAIRSCCRSKADFPTRLGGRSTDTWPTMMTQRLSNLKANWDERRSHI